MNHEHKDMHSTMIKKRNRLSSSAIICICFFMILFVLTSCLEPVFAQQPILSPRDSVEINFAGKKIIVNYGRPSMRNRKIMGELVPYGKIWRTGANEATSFITEMDLEMNGVIIPKGAYTLYTLPSPKQWKLIINKQTGQWGTVYNVELDLTRLNLKKRTLFQPVEKLTIILRKKNVRSGTLIMEWETTSLSIPFKIPDDKDNSKLQN